MNKTRNELKSIIRQRDKYIRMLEGFIDILEEESVDCMLKIKELTL